jgi:hypothetical protein
MRRLRECSVLKVEGLVFFDHEDSKLQTKTV